MSDSELLIFFFFVAAATAVSVVFVFFVSNFQRCYVMFLMVMIAPTNEKQTRNKSKTKIKELALKDLLHQNIVGCKLFYIEYCLFISFYVG